MTGKNLLILFTVTILVLPQISCDRLVLSCTGCDFYVSSNGTLWRGGSSCSPSSFACTMLSLPLQDIKNLSPDVFKGLTPLLELQLHRNDLQTVPTGVFSDLISLRQLWLSFNRITELSSGTFKNLAALQDLSLDFNMLTQLPNDIFEGLSSIAGRGVFLGGNVDLKCVPPFPPVFYNDGTWCGDHECTLQLPVCNSTLGRLGNGIADFSFPECIENRTWVEVINTYTDQQHMLSTGGLGPMRGDGFSVWACFQAHACISKVKPAAAYTESMCYKYHDEREKWHPLGLKSELTFCQN
jgi:hypothetical protein